MAGGGVVGRKRTSPEDAIRLWPTHTHKYMCSAHAVYLTDKRAQPVSDKGKLGIIYVGMTFNQGRRKPPLVGATHFLIKLKSVHVALWEYDNLDRPPHSPRPRYPGYASPVLHSTTVSAVYFYNNYLYNYVYYRYIDTQRIRCQVRLHIVKACIEH